jgi:cephalosporin-C deacetylase
VSAYDIRYNGFDETQIQGWLTIPTFLKQDKYPLLIAYHGFRGSRDTPSYYMPFIMMGMAVLSIDCREQGGLTGNSAVYQSAGMVDSVVTKGILDKEEYYFRAVYMDCVKAIDFAYQCPEIDTDRIAVYGGSQGGALGMAVCSLDSRMKAGIVFVPSNSNITARVEGNYGSFSAVNQFLRRYPHVTDQVFDTLSYFDTMNMADRIQCKILASDGLADPVCPAKLYFASYNRITSDKRIVVYPFNEHDGAHSVQLEKELAYLREIGLTS